AAREDLETGAEQAAGDCSATGHSGTRGGIPADQLNLDQPVRWALIDQVGDAVAIGVGAGNQVPVRRERVVGDHATADRIDARQILDFGQPIRGPPPHQIAQGVAIELARNWCIEGGAEDRRRSGSGYRLSKETAQSAVTDQLATIIDAEKLSVGSPRSVDRGELAVCTAAIQKTVELVTE